MDDHHNGRWMMGEIGCQKGRAETVKGKIQNFLFEAQLPMKNAELKFDDQIYEHSPLLLSITN